MKGRDRGPPRPWWGLDFQALHSKSWGSYYLFHNLSLSIALAAPYLGLFPGIPHGQHTPSGPACLLQSHLLKVAQPLHLTLHCPSSATPNLFTLPSFFFFNFNLMALTTYPTIYLICIFSIDCLSPLIEAKVLKGRDLDLVC